MSYQPTPLGPQGQQECRRPDTALVAAIGYSRARVLQALGEPQTTTHLALQLHTTPSATSQLLHRLKEAQLLQARRQGREVFYTLTPRGRDLLELFGSS